MNPDTASLFATTRHNRSLGLLLAGVIFAVVALGGSSALVRNFVTANASASARTVAVQHVG